MSRRSRIRKTRERRNVKQHGESFVKMKLKNLIDWRRSKRKEMNKINTYKNMTRSLMSRKRSEHVNGLPDWTKFKMQWVAWLILFSRRIRSKNRKWKEDSCNMLMKGIAKPKQQRRHRRRPREEGI